MARPQGASAVQAASPVAVYLITQKPHLHDHVCQAL